MFTQVSSPFLYKYLFQKANQNKRSKVIWATFYKKYKVSIQKNIHNGLCICYKLSHKHHEESHVNNKI